MTHHNLTRIFCFDLKGISNFKNNKRENIY